jgi:DNA-binding MarR family transcriptional regulator
VEATARDVKPAALAEQLLVLWRDVMQGSSGAFFALLEELDLTITQIKTLDTLSGCAEEQSVKELAERLGMSLPSASRTVEALLRRGWLERREDEHDRRIKRIRLTPEGRDVVARINGVRLDGLERFTRSLGRAEREQLSLALSAAHRSSSSPGT